MGVLLKRDTTLHHYILFILIHFLSAPPSFSPGCCGRPGAWLQPRLCPRQLLPSNRRLTGRTREELEGLVHMWDEEERALLHCQSSAGQFICARPSSFLHILSHWPLKSFTYDRLTSTSSCPGAGWEEVFRLWLQAAVRPRLQHHQSPDRERDHHIQTTPQEVLVAVRERWEDFVMHNIFKVCI